MTVQFLLAAQSIGDGAQRAIDLAARTGQGVGRVVGTFSSGFYVSVAGQLFAIGGPKIPEGPIHLVLRERPPLPLEQSPVFCRPGRIWTKSCTVNLTTGERFAPERPEGERLIRIARVLKRLHHPDAIPEDVAHLWPLVEAAMDRDDLHAVRKLLQGLGSGLTPTGDDVLAGILLFASWLDPASARPREVAHQTVTTQLSLAFLSWAANGQTIAPVYELLDAAHDLASARAGVPAHAAEGRFDRAAEAVAAIGRSSGQAILAGLGLAAETMGTAHRRAHMLAWI